MHAPLQLRRRFPIVGGALIVALLAGIWATDTAATASTAQMQTAESAYSEALSTVLAARTTAVTQVTEARADRTTATGSLASSAGTVLRPEAPDALSAAVALAEPLVVGAKRELAAGGSALTLILSTPKDSPAAYEAATASLGQLHPVGVTVDLATPTEAVTAAVLAWQDETAKQAAAASAKLAATQAAAAKAAATKAAKAASAVAAAAASPVPSTIVGPGPTAAAAPSGGTKVAQTIWDVWTAGGQPEIDACKGAVDLTAQYKVPVIVEHWFCGGNAFPTTAGATVTLTGLHAGLWRVDGVVLTVNATTQNTSVLPVDRELMFQTCNNNTSTTTIFIALTKVG
ncbi:hypothetical protein [Cryobacterium sp. GrIS_2_6]|uniref:hypothetical protein n=1 Tax=Cryobacterium sp. GrIS_2_6 TaxID=3162785 RepID=UPI002E06C89B|nr:hypothetical protein [Cryobacterium psychrotolerans]